MRSHLKILLLMEADEGAGTTLFNRGYCQLTVLSFLIIECQDIVMFNDVSFSFFILNQVFRQVKQSKLLFQRRKDLP